MIALGPDVMLQRVGTGAVLLQVRSGQYFELNETGADLLQFALEFQDPGLVLDRMQERYSAAREDLAADLDALFAELARASLLLLDADQFDVEN